jgi:hypothetical protein
MAISAPAAQRSDNMMRITEKGVFAALLFAFAAFITYQTLELRSDVGMVPRAVGILLMIFSGLQMLMDFFPAIRKRLSLLEGSSSGSLGGEGVVQDEQDPEDTLLHRAVFFGWIAVFVALIYLTNMLIATSVSLFIYLKWINRETWLLSVLYPAVMAAFIYTVFVLGFKLNYFV